MDLTLQQTGHPQGLGGGHRLNGPEFGDGLVVPTKDDHFPGFDLIEISGEVGLGFLDVDHCHESSLAGKWSGVKSEFWSGCAVLRDDLFVDFNSEARAGGDIEVAFVEGDGIADELAAEGALRGVEFDELGAALEGG